MKATEVANYLLYIMGDAFSDLTNMKINKLLYFAQGHYLQKYGKPLFEDEIEAWSHGPVVPEVYATYKPYRSRPIPSYDPSKMVEMPKDAEDVLFAVARKYGNYTASALRNKTHVVGSPWSQTYQKNKPHAKIPQPMIQRYFANLGALDAEQKQFNENDFVGYRDSDGILVLPKEWDDGEI